MSIHRSIFFLFLCTTGFSSQISARSTYVPEPLITRTSTTIQEASTNPTIKVTTTGGGRQDDDDDVPYWVPAIAKVVGAVLTQNVTGVIEESFGFIPPEVNKNIQSSLGLVVEQVEKLIPTTPEPTTKATPVPAVAAPIVRQQNSKDPEAAIAEIEAILAFALAQQIMTSLAGNGTGAGPVFPERPNSVPTQENIAPFTTEQPYEIQDATSIGSDYFVSSTFRQPVDAQQNIQELHSQAIGDTNGLAVYAPHYAPNYFPTTTTEKIPVYAPGFDYKRFTAVPTKRVATSQATTLSASIVQDNEITTESAPSTTDDDDDEYDDDDKRSLKF